MFSLYLIAIVILSLVIYFFIRLQIRHKAKTYRQQYLVLLDEAERLSLDMNRISALLAQQRHLKKIEGFESAAHMFENILVMLKEIHPHDGSAQILATARYFIKNCRKKLKNAVKHNPQEPLGFNHDKLYLGCYFCSKPFVFSGLSKVNARIDGENRKVFSCQSCKDELFKSDKVKVLHFLVEQTPKHWSEVKEYNPLRDYWHLSSGSLSDKHSRLRLIETHKADDTSET